MPFPYYGGEGDMATRMEITGKKMGWNSKCFYSNAELNRSVAPPETRFAFPEKENDFLMRPPSILISEFKPDFIISLFPTTYFSSKIPHYLALTRSNDVNIQLYGQELLKFDGYLCVPQNMDSFLQFLESHGKKFYGIDWYPTYGSTPYIPVKANRLFYCGTNYDPRRSSTIFYQLICLLDQAGYLDLYGTSAMRNWGIKSYKGEIPYDGKSLVETIKKSGISLILHSEEHLKSGVISGRIFEAAAAGNVIISDRHPFIMEEFGDCVLYLDIDEDVHGSSPEMFKQIDSYVQWILGHPKEAEEMAKKAHTIFVEKFSLESRLKALAEMHEQIQRDKKTGNYY